MGKKFPEQLKWRFITQFPGLAADNKFEITSPEDPKYNCISWAMMIPDRWTQPKTGDLNIDGVTWWPPEATNGMDISCLVEAFQTKGYEICDSEAFEDEYVKVALYFNPTNNQWTHAARMLRSGVWASKMGQSYDIEHASPHSIEGQDYGEVYCIMRAPFYSSKK